MAAQARRLATLPRFDHLGPVSFWQHGEEVYRLNEYEFVQFDIYGLPLGARWECSMSHWTVALSILQENAKAIGSVVFLAA